MEYESVSGISRHHETMWIERDDDGSIKQVYDRELKPIDKVMLHRSFEIITCEDGFTYKGEFIRMEDARDQAKKRAQGYQRRNWGHTQDQISQK